MVLYPLVRDAQLFSNKVCHSPARAEDRRHLFVHKGDCCVRVCIRLMMPALQAAVVVSLVPIETPTATLVAQEMLNRVGPNETFNFLEVHVNILTFHHLFQVLCCSGLDRVLACLALEPKDELVLLWVQIKVILEPNTEEQEDVVAPVVNPKEKLRRRIPLLPCVFSPAQLCCDPVVRKPVVRIPVRRPELCRVVQPGYHIIHGSQVGG